VWSALERKQFLKAAQLYLFSHHIVSILHIDSGDSSAPKLLVGSVFFKALLLHYLIMPWIMVFLKVFLTTKYLMVFICQRESGDCFVNVILPTKTKQR